MDFVFSSDLLHVFKFSLQRVQTKSHLRRWRPAEVKRMMSQIDAMKNVPQPRILSMEEDVQKAIEAWQSKIQKLGGIPKGYWLVDFDNGSGYFCWKFPEKDIQYTHGYQEGFTGRKEIPGCCNKDQHV